MKSILYVYNKFMWPDRDLTERLLAEVKSGGDAGELLARFREPLRRAVGMRLDPVLARRVDASDIVQDVLMEANRRLGDYLRSPTMPFALWLRHLARDQIVDSHRRHRTAQRRSLDREQPLVRSDDESSREIAALIVDGEKTPASAAIQNELVRKLATAIEELGDDDREIIIMRHHERLANNEVAETLGLTEAAASMRYLRAVRRLRTILLPDSPPSE